MDGVLVGSAVASGSLAVLAWRNRSWPEGQGGLLLLTLGLVYLSQPLNEHLRAYGMENYDEAGERISVIWGLPLLFVALLILFTLLQQVMHEATQALLTKKRARRRSPSHST